MIAIRTTVSRTIVLFGLAAVMCMLAISSGKALPPTGPGGTGGTNGDNGPKGPPRPQPSPWFAFNGNTAINVVKDQPPAKPTTTTVKTLNLKDDMTILWNGMTTDLEKTFKDYLSDKKNTGGRRLYNIKVKVAKADDKAKMSLLVDDKNKRIGLGFVVPGTQVEFKADTGHWYEPDPSMTVKMDLSLTMYINCNGGGANGPLALQSATLTFQNVRVDENIIGDVEGFFSQLFGGKDPAIKAERAFEAAHPNVTAKLSGAIKIINNVLNSFVNNPIVTPSYDGRGSRLVLTLSQRPPVATQAVPAAQLKKKK
jgi:hypothetical protein